MACFPCCETKAQTKIYHDSIMIQTREWSRDSERKIQYSDWRSYASHTVQMLNDLKPISIAKVDKYGGDVTESLVATGFFRTEKSGGRWMVIDPEGHPFVVAAINGLRQGKSPNNEKAFNQKYPATNDWIAASKKQFDELGFNCAGSWSDVEAIILYNKTAAKPLPYTTQLSLLAGYSQSAIKLSPQRKNASVLSFILDTAFVTYCDNKCRELFAGKSDPNLLGHFSDNEIAFLQTEFKKIIETGDKTDRGYLAAMQWMQRKNVTIATITKEQKEEFIGYMAGIYYKTVSAAIKKYDPNHLYIGSRLHSSAKNNKYMFSACEPYIDIISINYYGYWQPRQKDMDDWSSWSSKPFFITEFYTKGQDSGMGNISGAGWLVKTQKDRGIHYQNFCLQLLKAKNCVGWHWFRYQDNDPADTTSDPSNSDSNKGLVNTTYNLYSDLADQMKMLNQNKYSLVKYFNSLK